MSQPKRISQWVTSVVNVASKSEENLNYLKSILGPLKSNGAKTYNKLESQISLPDSDFSPLSSGFFEHEIVLRINDKVYIEEVNIYEKACGDSSLLKIDALKVNEANAEHSWFTLWQTDKQLPLTEDTRIFKPIITPTPFKTDTIRLAISGSLRLIDAIGESSQLDFIFFSPLFLFPNTFHLVI